MSQQKRFTIGDVAELRAYARQAKLYYGKTLDVDDLREVVREALADSVSDEMIDVFAMCCDPDFIELITSHSVAAFHAEGKL